MVRRCAYRGFESLPLRHNMRKTIKRGNCDACDCPQVQSFVRGVVLILLSSGWELATVEKDPPEPCRDGGFVTSPRIGYTSRPNGQGLPPSRSAALLAAPGTCTHLYEGLACQDVFLRSACPSLRKFQGECSRERSSALMARQALCLAALSRSTPGARRVAPEGARG